ncbi:alanine racemase [Bacillus chungangensis]|uniref:Alanine racemase n=1 Tax=Bacillus chungangensis TaxID=587633 RepID=A0ABT9WXY8_9BACI|nr:alanine racemase [Bacillus chungangensis]MDQ0178109.1 alanine racemase [Bacillus chungangensis]
MDKRFFRDTWVEVQLDYLYDNIRSIQSLTSHHKEIIAVVKANGYGHGAVKIARTALEAGAKGLAVAFVDEALYLRQAGIKDSILVLGVSRPEDVRMAVENDLTLTVFQEEWIREAAKYVTSNEKVKIHLKCDTGMGRIGVNTVETLQSLEQLTSEYACFIIEGIYTHFATADERDSLLFQQQLDRFQEMVKSLKQRPTYVHCANSAATLRMNIEECNAVRAGIAIYGLSPSASMKAILPIPLKEVFSLHTKIVHVKKLKCGQSISYGATYTTEDEEWIATLPIGYGDGWIRKLQGQEVLVNGQRTPIIGRICMDQCMIKLPYYMPPGEKVTLIGAQGDGFISIDEIAEKLETINYEVTCSISNRVPRVYMKNGEIVEVVNQLLSHI